MGLLGRNDCANMLDTIASGIRISTGNGLKSMDPSTEKPEPDSPKTSYSRAMTRMREGDWDGAIAQFNRAIDLNPGFVEAYANRGAARNAKGDLDGALADFDKAIELKPDSPGVKEIRRVLQRKQRRLKDLAPSNTAADKRKIPATNNTLALRTDFSDESAWKSICAAIRRPDDKFGFTANVDFVSDPQYDGLTAEQLLFVSATDSLRTFAFIIDRTALSHPDHPILVVDMHDEPGRTFRVIPSEMWTVENNLSIANMDFEDFTDALDQEGVFRGFQGP
jgi:tetratricopeptide (TPR) repeat protein